MTKETVCVRVDPEVWKNAKLFAVKSNMKLGELVEEAIKSKIGKK